MNLIEAIKSGKKYKRIGDREWKEASCTDHKTGCYYHYLDLIADDWEVEERPVTVTSSQFDAAYAEARQDFETDVWSLSFQDYLKRRLGL